MAKNLTTVVGRHLDTLAKFPDSPLSKAYPHWLSSKECTLVKYDDMIACVAGGPSPPFPFDSAHDYYAWASTHEVLAKVKIPLLALNADDDPMVPILPIDEGIDNLSPFVVFALTNGGGHLGWFEKGSYWGHSKRWVTKPVLEWLKATGEDMVRTPNRVRKLVDVDGFITEEGRSGLGCKVAGGGGHIVGVEGEEGLFAGL